MLVRRVCASPLTVATLLVRQVLVVLIVGPALLAGLVWLVHVLWFSLDDQMNQQYWLQQADAWQSAPRGHIMQRDLSTVMPDSRAQDGITVFPSVPENVPLKAVTVAEHAHGALASDQAAWKGFVVLCVLLRVIWLLWWRLIWGGPGCRSAQATVYRQANGTLHVVYGDGRQSGQGKGVCPGSLLHRYPLTGKEKKDES